MKKLYIRIGGKGTTRKDALMNELEVHPFLIKEDALDHLDDNIKEKWKVLLDKQDNIEIIHIDRGVFIEMIESIVSLYANPPWSLAKAYNLGINQMPDYNKMKEIFEWLELQPESDSIVLDYMCNTNGHKNQPPTSEILYFDV